MTLGRVVPRQAVARYGGRAGRIDWKDVVLRDVAPSELSYRMSDHYPLWTEFLIGDLPPS